MCACISGSISAGETAQALPQDKEVFTAHVYEHSTKPSYSSKPCILLGSFDAAPSLLTSVQMSCHRQWDRQCAASNLKVGRMLLAFERCQYRQWDFADLKH